MASPDRDQMPGPKRVRSPWAQPVPRQPQQPQGAATPVERAGLVSPAAAPQPATTAAAPKAPAAITVRPGQAAVPQRQQPSPAAIRESEEEEGLDLKAIAVRNAPPWLISSLFHMLVLIVLGLWFLPIKFSDVVRLEMLSADSDQIGDQLDAEPLGTTDEKSEALEEVITPQFLPQVDDPFAAPPELDVNLEGTTTTSKIAAPMIGLALSGREIGSKEQLLKRYGGNGITQGAVGLGLAWLAKQQRSDGSWSLKGPYADGGGFENIASATAMAMLAFQGDGHTHEKGKYKANVARGLKFLLGQQDADGNFFHSGPHNNLFYTQGQCAIALCELYGMTKDSTLREPAERAVRFCVENQDPVGGGWRYTVRDDSDTSVTGWVLMALQSARMAGLEVPQNTLDNAAKYLDRAQSEGGSRYSYVPGGEASNVMTAEALLCRQYLGWAHTDERLTRGADYLVFQENLPNWNDRNVYYWYYATQVLHHMEGQRWETWNAITRELLPARQDKKGSEAGSWHPTAGEPDRWGFQGGRLYVTCLSIYILEVYYRHLPLYSGGMPGQQVAAASPVPATPAAPPEATNDGAAAKPTAPENPAPDGSRKPIPGLQIP